MSLEQMAAMYAPGPVAQRALSMQAAVKREICSAEALALFAEKNVLQEPLGYAMLLRLHVYQFALQHASQQVAADIDALLAAQAELPQGKTLLLLRKLGVGVALLCSSAALPVCDAQTTEVLRLDLDLQQSSLNRMLQKEER